MMMLTSLVVLLFPITTSFNPHFQYFVTKQSAVLRLPAVLPLPLSALAALPTVDRLTSVITSAQEKLNSPDLLNFQAPSTLSTTLSALTKPALDIRDATSKLDPKLLALTIRDDVSKVDFSKIDLSTVDFSNLLPSLTNTIVNAYTAIENPTMFALATFITLAIFQSIVNVIRNKPYASPYPTSSYDPIAAAAYFSTRPFLQLARGAEIITTSMGFIASIVDDTFIT